MHETIFILNLTTIKTNVLPTCNHYKVAQDNNNWCLLIVFCKARLVNRDKGGDRVGALIVVLAVIAGMINAHEAAVTPLTNSSALGPQMSLSLCHSGVQQRFTLMPLIINPLDYS